MPAGAHAWAVRVVHTLPAQQPLGQLIALQTQAPPAHCWPTAHAAPFPQPQLPFAAHLSLKLGSQV
jgi:hypothetical protein